MGFTPQNAYSQSGGITPFGQIIREDRDPTSENINYPIYQVWINTETGNIWLLESFTSSSGIILANWVLDTAPTALLTLTGNTGGAISPTAGNINTVGTGSITITGAGSTLTSQLTGLTNHNVLLGAGTATITNLAPSATSGVPLISQGAASDPAFGTAVVAGGGTGATSFTAHSLLVGQGTSAVTALGAATNGQLPIGSTGANPVLALPTNGNNITWTTGAGSLTASVTGTTNHSIQIGNASGSLTSLGAATNGQLPIGSTGADPVLAALTAGTGITITNGAGSITISNDSSSQVSTITGNTGGAISPTAGNINTVGTGSITITGAGSTLTSQLTGLTNHNVLLGAGTATITNLAPSATSGVPLISQGAASDPAFGTAVVAGGGTGLVTTTAYGLITGGTTATGNFQNPGTGTSGQIYVSGGPASLGTWTNPSSIGGMVLISTLTASSSASLDFTNASTYSMILLFLDVTLATNTAGLRLRVSTDNGATWRTTAYKGGINYNLYTSTTLNNANNTAYFPLSGPSANTTPISGTVFAVNFGLSSEFQINGTLTYNDSTLGDISFGYFGGQAVTSVNAIQLIASSGNIAGGFASLYGYRNS